MKIGAPRSDYGNTGSNDLCDWECTSEQALRLYGRLFQLRSEENQYYWQKVNWFIVSQAALFGLVANAFPALKADHPFLLAVVSLAGFALSVFMVQMVRGALYWTVYFQRRMAALERAHLQGEPLFSRSPDKGSVHRFIVPVSLAGAILTLCVVMLLLWTLVLGYALRLLA